MDQQHLKILNSTQLPSIQPRSVKPIRILLVDDQITVRQIWQSYLEKESGLEIVGSATNGTMALEWIETLHPDIALVDIEMPGIDGIETTRRIRDRFPSTEVLVLSSHDREDYIRQALDAGAKGYLLKNTPAAELIHAIQFIRKGYLHLGPGLFEKLEPHSATSASRNGDAIAAHQESADPARSKAIVPTPSSEAVVPVQPESVSITEQSWTFATQELMDALPHVWSRGLLYVLLILVATVLPWAMFSKVDETGSARGQLVPKAYTLDIAAPTAGTVVAVRAKEGQLVEKGQVLLELDAALQRSDLQQTLDKLEGQKNRFTQLTQLQTQLVSTLNTQQLQNQAQALEKQAQIDQAQDNLGTARRSTPLQESEKYAQVEQAQQALDAAQRNYGLAQKRSQKEANEVQRYRTLAQQGAVAQIQVIEAERKADESDQAMEGAIAAVSQAEKRLKEQQSSYRRLQEQLQSDQTQSQSRLNEKQNNQRSLGEAAKLALLEAQKQLKDAEGQIKVLKTEMAQTHTQIQTLTRQLKERTIIAPEKGTLFQMPIKTAKTYLQTGQLVAQIAPQDSPLTLRAQMPSQNSGFLKVGQPVKLKFDAYPFQTYGIVPGRLVSVSPNSKTIDTAQGKVQVFDIEVTPDRTEIRGNGKSIPLTAGQAATAEVVVRQRRVIDFLLDPFKQLQKDGLQL
jgi:hemolysin D